MSNPTPQPTDVLIDRLRRMARVFDGYAKDVIEGRPFRERKVEAWRGFANTCLQAAGRLDDLSAPQRLRDELKAELGAVSDGEGSGHAPSEADRVVERLRGLTRWRVYVDEQEPNQLGAWVEWRDVERLAADLDGGGPASTDAPK